MPRFAIPFVIAPVVLVGCAARPIKPVAPDRRQFVSLPITELPLPEGPRAVVKAELRPIRALVGAIVQIGPVRAERNNCIGDRTRGRGKSQNGGDHG